MITFCCHQRRRYRCQHSNNSVIVFRGRVLSWCAL